MNKIQLGPIFINPIGYNDLIGIIDNAIAASGKTVTISYANMHSLYMALTNEQYCAYINEHSIVYIDGMPLVWYIRYKYGVYDHRHRLTMLDIYRDVFIYTNKKRYNVIWIGGDEEVSGKASKMYGKKYSNIKFIDGYKDMDEYMRIINECRYDIVILGMGAVVQERLALMISNKNAASVVWSVGGTLDYLTGKTITPPRYLGRIGLEGVFRLFTNRRTFYRYTYEPLYILIKYLARR